MLKKFLNSSAAAALGLLVLFTVFVVGAYIAAKPAVDTHDVATTAPQPTVTKTVTVTPSPSVTPSETAEQTDARYGQSYSYPNGLKVTVAKPKAYPKDPNVVMKDDCYWLFTVSIKNVSKTTFKRTADLYSEVNGGAGNYQASEGNGRPETSIAPGETLTYTEVFGSSCKRPVYGLAMSPLFEVDRSVTWG